MARNAFIIRVITDMHRLSSCSSSENKYDFQSFECKCKWRASLRTIVTSSSFSLGARSINPNVLHGNVRVHFRLSILISTVLCMLLLCDKQVDTKRARVTEVITVRPDIA